MRHVLSIVFVAMIGTLPACAQWTTPEYGKDFDAHWRDGKAELASYDLVYPRYGELRKGTAVAITVTEPFLWEPRVKADDPDAAGKNSFGVVKLNMVEDFATGVYDYNLMTSVFVATEKTHGLPAGVPVKVSFTSQEWCGHVFQQANFDAKKVAYESRSYFEKEADEDRELGGHKEFIAEDALMLWARGLAGPVVAEGKMAELPMFRSAAVSRLRHVPVAWDTVTLSQVGKTSRVRTKALGDVEIFTKRAVVKRSDSGETETYTFIVEAVPPHRVIKMSRSDGYDAVLVGVSREPYWSQHGEGDEDVLGNFGLSPRGLRTP